MQRQGKSPYHWPKPQLQTSRHQRQTERAIQCRACRPDALWSAKIRSVVPEGFGFASVVVHKNLVWARPEQVRFCEYGMIGGC